MNAEQRSALRKLAEEATPGPWYSGSDYVTADLTFDSVLLQLNSTGSAADWFDLGYIAAANPQAILQLLDYIETLEKDAARYRWLSEYFVSDRADLDDALVACESMVALNIMIDAALGETE